MEFQSQVERTRLLDPAGRPAEQVLEARLQAALRQLRHLVRAQAGRRRGAHRAARGLGGAAAREVV